MLNNNTDKDNILSADSQNTNKDNSSNNKPNNPLDSYLMKKTIVIKVGGSTLGFDDTTLSDVVKLQNKGYFPIVIHGGGADISEWMKKVGKRPKFVDGRRVTDKETLNIVISVLAGKVNTEMVNQ